MSDWATERAESLLGFVVRSDRDAAVNLIAFELRLVKAEGVVSGVEQCQESVRKVFKDRAAI